MQFKGHKIVVTGGCGFIGSHLVKKLLSKGASEVVALDSLEYGSQKNLADMSSKSVRIFQFKVGSDSYDRLREIFKDASYVFHYAAEKHNQSKHSPQKVVDANIRGILDILQASVEVKVKRFVFASSLYAYGRMTGTPFVETEHPRPLTVYGISKLTGEQLVEFYSRNYGLSAGIIRFLFVYGPQQYAGQGYKSVIVKNLTRMISGEAPIVNGDGKQVLDYIYVDDAVRASLMVAADTRSCEVYNVGSGIGISVNDLIQKFYEYIPGAPQPVPGPADFTAGSYRVANIEKIKEYLGFQTETPLTEGLRNTYEWLKGKLA